MKSNSLSAKGLSSLMKGLAVILGLTVAGAAVIPSTVEAKTTKVLLVTGDWKTSVVPGQQTGRRAIQGAFHFPESQ